MEDLRIDLPKCILAMAPNVMNKSLLGSPKAGGPVEPSANTPVLYPGCEAIQLHQPQEVMDSSPVGQILCSCAAFIKSYSVHCT